MYALIKFFLFRYNPEEIHHKVMRCLNIAYRIPAIRKLVKRKLTVNDKNLERTLWGIKFKNPVGLAAGFDKDAKFIDELDMLGFGFIEIGTVTPKAQEGNPKPRLFRLPGDRALINRMGFNNGGVKAAAERLRNRKSNIVIGGNIGKNKTTLNQDAILDYEICFKELYPLVDYFTVNVSSPNTPNLRELQDKEPLLQLLSRLQKLNNEKGKGKPILLKIAPDLSNTQLDDIVDIIQEVDLHGIVATNTTIQREGLATSTDQLQSIGSGGLSGMPLKNRSTEIVKYIHEKSKGRIVIIAVGGIENAQDVKEKLEAGASLVQIYTGFIYEGPFIVKQICKGLKI